MSLSHIIASIPSRPPASLWTSDMHSACSVVSSPLPPGVPARLRDLRHGGEDAGGQGPQLGKAASGSPQGKPRGDPGAMPGRPQALYQRTGRDGAAAGISLARSSIPAPHAVGKSPV